MMRTFASFALLLLSVLSACGQESADTLATHRWQAVEPHVELLSPTDSLALPPLDRLGRVQSVGLYPVRWGGWYDWRLHEGLNMSLGASVFGSFGHNAYHGAGFAQDVSLMYAVPLSARLSMAVGGYFSRLSWRHDTYNDAGLTAMLGYRFDEHWEGSLYLHKSLAPDRRFMLLPLSELSDFGDRIGAMVTYNVTPSFSISVSVESREYRTGGWNGWRGTDFPRER